MELKQTIHNELSRFDGKILQNIAEEFASKTESERKSISEEFSRDTNLKTSIRRLTTIAVAKTLLLGFLASTIYQLPILVDTQLDKHKYVLALKRLNSDEENELHFLSNSFSAFGISRSTNLTQIITNKVKDATQWIRLLSPAGPVKWMDEMEELNGEQFCRISCMEIRNMSCISLL